MLLAFSDILQYLGPFWSIVMFMVVGGFFAYMHLRHGYELSSQKARKGPQATENKDSEAEDNNAGGDADAGE